MDYALSAETPDPGTYMRLRAAGGLSPYAREAAEKGLPGTVFSVLLRHEGESIGMGRIIGDGGLFFQIVDIVVIPEHQGKGLGHRIMEALMAHVREELPASAYVSLMADVPADRLYAKFGFQPTAPKSIGMAYRNP